MSIQGGTCVGYECAQNPLQRYWNSMKANFRRTEKIIKKPIRLLPARLFEPHRFVILLEKSPPACLFKAALMFSTNLSQL